VDARSTKLAPLVETVATPDVFASELVGVEQIEGTGCVRAVFAVSCEGVMGARERQIVARIVMPATMIASTVEQTDAGARTSACLAGGELMDVS
jgi:hypothetical protein